MEGNICAKLATYSQPTSANKGEPEARHSGSGSWTDAGPENSLIHNGTSSDKRVPG